MNARLHRAFLLGTLVVYGAVWMLSNVGPFGGFLRDALVLEVLTAALVADLLWQLIASNQSATETRRGEDRLLPQLERQSTQLAGMLPLLGLRVGSTWSEAMPRPARQLIRSRAEELAKAVSTGELQIPGRAAVVEEAIRLIETSQSRVLTKSHIPATLWKDDRAGRRLTEYLLRQQGAATVGLTRIHVYDETRLAGWTHEEWSALEWLAGEHERLALELRLCAADWDRRSPDLEMRGLVYGEPDGIGTVLFFEQPDLGTTAGRIVWDPERVAAARSHLQTMLRNSLSWSEFTQHRSRTAPPPSRLPIDVPVCTYA